MMGEGWASVLCDPEASWPPGVAGKEVTRKSRQVLRASEASLWKVSLTHEAEAGRGPWGPQRLSKGRTPVRRPALEGCVGGVACWRSLLSSERDDGGLPWPRWG